MISSPASKTMLTIIKTHQDNGPYFPATNGCYQAATLQQLIFHVRQAMEDREHVIGVYGPDGACRGLWLLNIEGHVDSAGDAIVDHEAYELFRPSTKEQWMWKRLQEHLA
jgi:hypothetical protein